MEIAQIVSTAKEKIGTTSLSDRTITDYFTAINPQAEPDDAFWAAHTAILKSMNGQLSHEIAEYAKAHPATEPPTPPAPPAAGLSPEMQELFNRQNEAIEKLTNLVNGQQHKMTEDMLRGSASAQAEQLHVANRNIWNDAVNRTNIADGMTAEQFNAQVKTTYEQNLKAFLGEGVKPYGSASPADPSAKTKATLDAFFASKGFGQK